MVCIDGIVVAMCPFMLLIVYCMLCHWANVCGIGNCLVYIHADIVYV